MRPLKSIEAAHYLAGVLLLVGLVHRRFLVIRPNRIENGYNIDMIAAIKGNFLLMALFLMVVLLLVLSFVLYYKKRGGKFLGGINLLTLFSVTIIMIGRMATSSLQSVGTAGRASLGIGAWCLMAGIILIMWQGSKDDQSFKLMILSASLVIIIGLYKLDWIMDISVIRELSNKSDRIFGEVVRHMQLTFGAVITGLMLSLILSYGAYRHKRIEGVVAGIVSFAQVVPTLSLLGLLMIPLVYLSTKYPTLRQLGISGIGFFPAYIVLTLYTLLPMVNNTLTGFKSIPKQVITTAFAMGMTHRQVLWRIQLPMVFPSIVIGFRIALVQTVGNCTLAGLVGGGGIGTILFLGLAQSAPDLVIVASLMIVLIAVMFEVMLSRVEKTVNLKLRGDLYHD